MWKHCWRSPSAVAGDLSLDNTLLLATLAIQRFTGEAARSMGGHSWHIGLHLEINQQNLWMTHIWMSLCAKCQALHAHKLVSLCRYISVAISEFSLNLRKNRKLWFCSPFWTMEFNSFSFKHSFFFYSSIECTIKNLKRTGDILESLRFIYL